MQDYVTYISDIAFDLENVRLVGNYDRHGHIDNDSILLKGYHFVHNYNEIML